jgi:hypothetical protein
MDSRTHSDIAKWYERIVHKLKKSEKVPLHASYRYLQLEEQTTMTFHLPTSIVQTLKGSQRNEVRQIT